MLFLILLLDAYALNPEKVKVFSNVSGEKRYIQMFYLAVMRIGRI